ncbi:MAG: hypothetical protein H7321_00715 [Bacteroidia bacterium]|nr:hypothetical protein [Bacteroidia bacterium]
MALCDNKYQGIVPVPAKIGNGQDPDNNLYWGCGYGIRTYFKKSAEWKLIRKTRIDSVKLERVIFKHRTKNYYLIADAYNGKYIKQCTIDFLKGCAGSEKDTVQIDNKTLGIKGSAGMLSYIGHDGLMDFEIDETFENTDGKTRKCIILACISKSYFAPLLKQTKAEPIVWTTGLMCPEAYTVHDALSGYVLGESPALMRNRSVQAYAKYHSCGTKGASRLLVSGY